MEIIPSSRSQLRPAPAPGPMSNQGRPGGLLDAVGLACTWASTGEAGPLPTSLRLGSRSRLVFVDPPRARCSASRSSGDGANARIASPERKPGVLLLVAVAEVGALPLRLSLILLLRVLRDDPDTGNPDADTGATGALNSTGSGEKLKTFASGLSPLRGSVPSMVERLSLSEVCHHKFRASCGGIPALGGEIRSESARDDHTREAFIGSDVIR